MVIQYLEISLFHFCSLIPCLTFVSILNREDHIRICDFDNCGGGKPHPLHILGGQAFLGPFLFAAIMVLMVFALIQVN